MQEHTFNFANIRYVIFCEKKVLSLIYLPIRFQEKILEVPIVS